MIQLSVDSAVSKKYGVRKGWRIKFKMDCWNDGIVKLQN